MENQAKVLIKKGVLPENIFKDVGSAKNLEREGLKRLMAVVTKGDEIFVQRLDRLARNTAETLGLIDTWDKEGTLRALCAEVQSTPSKGWRDFFLTP